MAKSLSAQTQSQIDRKRIRRNFTISIGGAVNRNVISYSCSFQKEFGIASLTVNILNNNGQYSMGATNEIKLGDKVILTEAFKDTTDTYTNFTGYARQRAIQKTGNQNILVLTCLDYIVKLEDTDIEQSFEATKIYVTNETLTPTYLPAPNNNTASVFSFANDDIAMKPPPIISFYDRVNSREYIQNAPGDILYETGQLVMGSALNVRNDWHVKAKSYYHYSEGLYVEDILEDIIVAQDGYSNWLFGATSEQNLIDNHLTETFNNITGQSSDTMTPNLTTTEDVDVITTLDTACSEGDTSITVADTTGFPSSGSGTVAGDSFSWTGKTSTTLTGCSGLLTHGVNSAVKYTADYSAGQLWYLSYNNLITTLTASDFSIPGGASFQYFDKRNGRLILDTAISTLSTVTCGNNYSFKTIQRTGIQISKKDFTYSNTKNRLDAIRQLRENLAPNYLIRTIGSDKLWASYVTQKTTADYTLELPMSLSYAEDVDIYTRTKFYGINSNPENQVYGGTPEFTDTGESYVSETLNHELTYYRDEGNWRVYNIGINTGSFYTANYQPRVRVNGTPVNNLSNVQTQMPVSISTVNAGVASEPGRFHATIYLPTGGIDSSYGIYFYNANGVRPDIFNTAPDGQRGYIEPGNSYVNWDAGQIYVTHQSPGSLVTTIASATYRVRFTGARISIDYANLRIKLDRSIIPDPNKTVVTADFEYSTRITAFSGNVNMIDGRYDTQSQQIFYAEPPGGYVLWILDLGETKSVQAIDIISGFFKPPDEAYTPDVWSRRKYDIHNIYTLKYSTNDTDWYNISKETQNFRLLGGENISFEKDVLGEDFEARYLRLEVADMNRIDYGDGVWVASFTEIMVYTDLILIGEAKLIPTTALAVATSAGDATITVDSTSGFSSSGTAYISTDAFTYTGTAGTIFTGCSDVTAHAVDTRVSQTLEDDTTIYDDDGLLPKLGDKVYKDTEENEFLDTQEKVDKRAKDYLTEFYKDHSKIKAEVLYGPHLRVTQTVRVVDSQQSINRNYFIESLTDENGKLNLILGRYPS